MAANNATLRGRELAVLGTAFAILVFYAATACLVAQDVPKETGLAELPVEAPSRSVRPELRSKIEAKPHEVVVSGDREKKSFDYTTLFDEPKKLKRLDRTAPIWATTDRSCVALGGKICLREGWLEFFACRLGSKEHESIVALDVPPHLIHAALLAIGAKQGAPAKYDPVFTPPSGDEIDIFVRWRDEKTGKVRQIRAQEMIKDEQSGKTMDSPWVFTGGLFGVDPDGKKYYLANVTGEIFGVANFPGSVLDVPYESSNDNSQLSYVANAEKIPPVDSDVLLVLSRAKRDGESVVDK